ncbi:MAG TPA: DUF938 domain-containing protein [Dongiaceae bacterium]|nr:DUF938 domain-containing protein [Dongiaceae bacterium]
MHKPFSQACENNQQPILELLRRHINEAGTLLEIGSGTGQHAVFMGRHLSQVQWQPTDQAQNLPGIEAWRTDAGLANVLPALPFDVWDAQIPLAEPARYLFSANTLHIMGWETVQRFFSLIPSLLQNNGMAFFYGPFNYGGTFTSDSNARFDQWLKANSPQQGIRDFEAVAQLAHQAGLSLIEDCAMPANNRTLVWRRQAG